MNQLMQGKAGLVTGAGAGIGRASALEFAREGASVVVSDISLAAMQETVALIEAQGGAASYFPCDIADEQQVQALVAATVERYGRLDFAHNNAGIIPETGPLVETSSQNWERVIQVNVTGTYYCLKHELAAMLAQGGGAIVCTSSVAGLLAGRNQSSYISSKWAINGLVKCAALEYARHNIRVNAINPGATLTALSQQAMDAMPEQRDRLTNSIPTGSIATPEDQAKAAVWLCADFNKQITGALLTIDGGYSAGRYDL